MKRFSDKALIYMGSNFIASFLQLVMGMLMVRHLTKFDYGTFRQIMLFSVLISSTIAIGLPQSLSYFIPRVSADKEKKQLAFQVFILLTLLGLVAAAVSYLFRFWISEQFNNPELLHYSWIFSLFFLFLIPSKCTQPTLVSLGRTKFASLLNAGTSIFNFFFVIIPLLLGKDLRIILIFMLSVYILKFLLVTSILLTLKGGWPKLLDFPSLKSQFVYSFPLGGSIMVGVVRKYIDQFIIAFFYTPVNFAVYSRGAFELPFVALLPYTLSTLMIPKIAEYHKEGKRSSILHLWQESMWKVSLVFFPLFVYAFIFADEIITLLFTSNYSESVLIFRIYLVLLPVRIASYRTILQAIGKTRIIFKAVNISLFLSVSLGIVLERIFGFSGPAVAIVISELAGCGYMLWQTKIHMKLSFWDLLPYQRLIRPLSCSLIACVLILPLDLLNLEVSTFILLTMSALLYFGSYGLIMRAFNFFTESDLDFIYRWATLRVLRENK